MRILAIDASPCRGVVSLSVEAAARSAERAEAHVDRVRLAELKVMSCTGCGMCRYGEGCKISDDLPALAQMIAESDGVIFGIPAYFRHPDPAVRTTLDRLARFFPADGQLVLPGVNPVRARRPKRQTRGHHHCEQGSGAARDVLRLHHRAYTGAQKRTGGRGNPYGGVARSDRRLAPRVVRRVGARKG